MKTIPAAVDRLIDALAGEDVQMTAKTTSGRIEQLAQMIEDGDITIGGGGVKEALLMTFETPFCTGTYINEGAYGLMTTGHSGGGSFAKTADGSDVQTLKEICGNANAVKILGYRTELYRVDIDGNRTQRVSYNDCERVYMEEVTYLGKDMREYPVITGSSYETLKGTRIGYSAGGYAKQMQISVDVYIQYQEV